MRASEADTESSKNIVLSALGNDDLATHAAMGHLRIIFQDRQL